MIVGAADKRIFALAQCRLKLSKLLHQNLMTETRELGVPLRRHDLTGAVADYDAINSASSKMRLAYSKHVQTWGLGAIKDDWPKYCDDVKALIDEVRDLLRRKIAMLPIAERLLKQSIARS